MSFAYCQGFRKMVFHRMRVLDTEKRTQRLLGLYWHQESMLDIDWQRKYFEMLTALFPLECTIISYGKTVTMVTSICKNLVSYYTWMFFFFSFSNTNMNTAMLSELWIHWLYPLQRSKTPSLKKNVSSEYDAKLHVQVDSWRGVWMLTLP